MRRLGRVERSISASLWLMKRGSIVAGRIPAALAAVWPRPQIEASRMAWAISRNRVISWAAEPSGVALHQSLQRFLLAHHADAARNTLAASFMAEETGNAQQNVAKIDRVIKQHDYARTEQWRRWRACLQRLAAYRVPEAQQRFRPRRPARTACSLPLPATPPARSMSVRSVVPMAIS